MRIRNDLKKSNEYRQALNKYKIKVKKSRKVINIILLVILAIFIFMEIFGLSDMGFFTLFANIVLWWGLIYIITSISLITPYRVVEFYVTDKKIYRDSEDTNYYIYEDSEKFTVSDNEIYYKLNIGQYYTFLCQGKTVVEIMNFS